jgi:hypothetical protein
MTTFSVVCSTFGQTIKEDKKNMKLDPDNKKKVDVLVNSLIGDWELIKTIWITNGDTLTQEPSSAPMGMTTAKPPTTIHFDTLQTFKISQWCMKCPLIAWAGHYTIEIKIYKGLLGLFYLTFVENRDNFLKKKQKSFTAEFNGYFTNFENGTLQLTDDKGCDWIYKRKTKQ